MKSQPFMMPRSGLKFQRMGGDVKSFSCQTQVQLRLNWVELTLKLWL